MHHRFEDYHHRAVVREARLLASQEKIEHERGKRLWLFHIHHVMRSSHRDAPDMGQCAFKMIRIPMEQQIIVLTDHH